MAQAFEVTFHLLKGDHVEAGDNLGDATQGMQVSFWAVILLTFPTLGKVTKASQIPSSDEQVTIRNLGRNIFVKCGAQ